MSKVQLSDGIKLPSLHTHLDTATYFIPVIFFKIVNSHITVYTNHTVQIHARQVPPIYCKKRDAQTAQTSTKKAMSVIQNGRNRTIATFFENLIYILFRIMQLSLDATQSNNKCITGYFFMKYLISFFVFLQEALPILKNSKDNKE